MVGEPGLGRDIECVKTPLGALFPLARRRTPRRGLAFVCAAAERGAEVGRRAFGALLMRGAARGGGVGRRRKWPLVARKGWGPRAPRALGTLYSGSGWLAGLSVCCKWAVMSASSGKLSPARYA